MLSYTYMTTQLMTRQLITTQLINYICVHSKYILTCQEFGQFNLNLFFYNIILFVDIEGHYKISQEDITRYRKRTL